MLMKDDRDDQNEIIQTLLRLGIYVRFGNKAEPAGDTGK